MKYLSIFIFFLSLNLFGQKVNPKEWFNLNENFKVRILNSSSSRASGGFYSNTTTIAKKGYRITTIGMQIENVSDIDIDLDLRNLELVVSDNTIQKVGGIQMGSKIRYKVEKRIFKVKSGKKKLVFIEGLYSQAIPKEQHIIGLKLDGKFIPFIFKPDNE